MNGTINIALTNLGQYNEGILNFVWLSLPASDEEIAAAFDQIQVSHDGVHYYSDGLGHASTEAHKDFYGEYEEYFITDYECDFMEINEYSNLEVLNEIAEQIESLDEYEQEIVKALIDDGYTLEQALEEKDNCYVYSGCNSMAEVAEQYAEETGLLDSIPENLRYYFDFEAFGRDMSFEGHWIATNNGYIEVA